MNPNPDSAAKRPIDRLRDAGGSFEVGTAEEGPVGSMIEIDGSLYLIKPSAIYALDTADRIDPERTNIALPKVITRRVLPVGSNSELVGKILLTAVSLLDKGKFVRQEIDTQRGLSITLDALISVLTMQTMAADFEAAQEAACVKAEAQHRSGHSEQMPFLGDVKSRCKSFMQQTHHAVGDLIEIVQLFYPEIKKSPWDTLQKKIADELGEEDAFAKFLKDAVPFFKLVRNTRDVLEHDNPRGGTVKDFEVQPHGQSYPPTIEINFRGSQHPRVAVSAFMNGMIASIVSGFEMMLAHLCNANALPPRPPIPIYIGMPAQNRRRWKHVRFYFGSLFNDEFVPIG